VAVNEDNDLLTLESFLSDYRERDWIKDAACRGMDTSIFFPERGDMPSVELAKSICRTCNVQQQCREYGDMERFGFWGGVGVRNRVKERREST
jgi:WhiB family redox-sensing transcriptional regulator